MTLLCDAHVHVVAGAADHPMVPGRPYTPAPAPLAALTAVATRERIERFVVVQPSFYGSDNAVLVEALRALGGRGRGVAVLDPETAGPAELDALAEAGVRGVRINLYSPGSGLLGGGLAERFGGAAALAARRAWHVEVLADLPVLVAAEDLLASSPAPVVVDHYGLPGRATPGSAEGRRWLALARRPHVWVKLSAPYRSAGDPLDLVPDRDWLEALLDAAGERCLWGSDWPHTPPHDAQPGDGGPAPYRPVDYPALVEAFRAALPSGVEAERVMGDNAGRLYGFDA